MTVRDAVEASESRQKALAHATNDRMSSPRQVKSKGTTRPDLSAE
jgi:hypothetical protein